MPNSTGQERMPAIARDPSGMTPQDLAENVLNHRYVFLGVFMSCLLLACMYALIATPVFSANALIQVEDKKSSALGSLSTVTKALDVDGSPILGEIDILHSRTVVTQAVEAINAETTVSVRNTFPLIGRWLATVLPKDADGLVQAPFESPVWAWGGENITFSVFDVPSDQMGKRLELVYSANNQWLLKNRDGITVLSGTVGTLAASDGYRVLVKSVVAHPGTEFRLVRYATQERVEDIIKKLYVAETKRESGIIQLEYNDANPIYASRLVNAIAAAYLASNVQRRSQESARSLGFLEAQLPVVSARLKKAEDALNAFRNREGSIDVAGEIRVLLEQSEMVEKAKFDAQLSYQDLISKYQPGQPQRDAAAEKFKQLDLQARQISKQIALLPSVQQEYLRLSRDVEVSNQLYIGLENNAQQLQIATAGTVGNASMVDQAVAPDKPVRPKPVLLAALGGIIGLILGFAAAQIMALASGRIRDPKRLEAMVGIETLGILPISAIQKKAERKNDSAYLISREESETPLVEALESLALALRFSLAKKEGGKVVLVTSAVPNQGKSLISANLAYLLAEKGLKTLLLDADMRKSTVHRYLSVSQLKGLSGVLQGTSETSDVIATPYDNLHALPAGKRTNKTSRLFGTEQLEPLIESLRQQYDVVIIDSPPVLPVLDAAALSKYADMTVFVARQGAVSYAEVIEAVERLAKVGTTVDGMVFNGFAPSPLRYGYYSNAYKYMSAD
jgi:tyrosine-protein kinase Etk/Wzc